MLDIVVMFSDNGEGKHKGVRSEYGNGLVYWISFQLQSVVLFLWVAGKQCNFFYEIISHSAELN